MLPGALGEVFFDGDGLTCAGKLQQEKQQYLKAIGYKKPLQQWESLSTRQRQCLGLYGQGLSASIIATQLELSLRTVEYYINQLRNKLGCSSKAQLIEAYRLFKELELL